MAVTLREISKHLGISYQTVADVLDPLEKRSHRYNLETRERIGKLAKELGYKPNRAARSMVTGKFQSISLLLSGTDGKSLMPSTMLSGMLEACEKANMTLSVAHIETSLPFDRETQPLQLKETSSDGFLMNYNDPPPQGLDAVLSSQGTPVIWINNDRATDSISPDDLSAGRIAAETLINHGHRNGASLSLIHGRDIWEKLHFSFHARRRGFLEEFEKQGLRGIDATPLNISGAWDEALALVEGILKAENRPTAFLIQDRMEAEALTVTAARLGIKIPEELSIIIVWDENIKVLGRNLSRVGTDRRILGQRAVELLLGKIAGKAGEAPSESTPYEYFKGDTVSYLSNANLTTRGT